jgi:hypothetical protein
MKQLLIASGITALLLCVGLSGCDQQNNTLDQEKTRFLGTWQNITTTYTQTLFFNSNGTCSHHIGVGNIFNGVWDLKEGNLVINLTSIGLYSEYYYEFSNNDNTLTLTFTGNNYVEVWTKQ